jgi:hypothetical protein
VTTTTPFSRILRGANPLGIDPNSDLRPAKPRHDLPGWSETYFWSAWDPAEQVGLFIHSGTSPDDVELWWTQVLVYLPDGRALANMSWGRNNTDAGPVTGNFSARCEEAFRRWTLRFDGAAEPVTAEQMATGLVGSGASVPLSFEVELTAMMPVWDLFKATEVEAKEWAGLHHEQVLTSTGRLTVGGDGGGQWGLNGVSFRDHSIGARTLDHLGGDHLFGVHFPGSGRSLTTLIMFDNAGDTVVRSASITEGDQFELLERVAFTGAEPGTVPPRGLLDSYGNPRAFEMTLVRADGQDLVVAGEALHNVNISLVGSNTNLNGSAMDADGDPLILCECPVRMSWPDGEVGYGHLERTYRRSMITKAARS